jgi:hypothetical protein
VGAGLDDGDDIIDKVVPEIRVGVVLVFAFGGEVGNGGGAGEEAGGGLTLDQGSGSGKGRGFFGWWY